jgi:hypothetical protein
MKVLKGKQITIQEKWEQSSITVKDKDGKPIAKSGTD